MTWDRMDTMRRFIRAMSDALYKVNAHLCAQTYGVPVSAVEAEIIRNLPEGGEGK